MLYNVIRCMYFRTNLVQWLTPVHARGIEGPGFDSSNEQKEPSKQAKGKRVVRGLAM